MEPYEKLDHAEKKRATEKLKIYARTTPDVADRLVLLLMRARRRFRRTSADGRSLALSREVLIGAIIRHFLDLPPKVQDKILEQDVPRFSRELEQHFGALVEELEAAKGLRRRGRAVGGTPPAKRSRRAGGED